jgi:hypothetical protein
MAGTASTFFVVAGCFPETFGDNNVNKRAWTSAAVATWRAANPSLAPRVRYVDTTGWIDGRQAPLGNTIEGLHPNAEGNTMIAAQFAPIIAYYYHNNSTITLGTPTSSSVSVTWTNPTGGNGTISSQVQKSTNGVDWSDVVGATSSPATVAGLNSSTPYSIRVTFADATPTQVTSPVAQTTTAAGTYVSTSAGAFRKDIEPVTTTSGSFRSPR